MYRDEKYTTTPSSVDTSYNCSGNALNSFINRVFGWMFVGLAATGAISWYLGTFLAEKVLQYRGMYLFLVIAELVVVIALTAGIRKFSAMTATILFLVFALLNGVTLSWIFIAYSTEVIAGTFFATSGTFGLMGLYGYLTKRDLSSIGSLCSMGLIGIVIASIINIFWYNRTADLVISCIGVLIFVGLTAWDVQKIKRLAIDLANNSVSTQDVRKYAIMGALELYLDFINLFLFLLRIFGGGRK